MSAPRRPWLLLAGAIALVAGCDPLWPDAYWRSERYVLAAIDAPEELSLMFDGNGLTGIVGPTVFSVGADQTYIVLKQHPRAGFEQPNRAITNYFVVERTTSMSMRDRANGVRGPLTKAQFDELAGSLSLPEFTVTFENLD